MTRAELDKRINERMDIRSIAEGARLVSRAREYALKMHGDQKYGTEPYSVHLDDVENILIEFNHISSILRAAGLLHDVLEDTNADPKLFQIEFPGYVYLIVEAVTSEPGKNRKERNRLTYPKIVKLEYAIIVKLSDRLANGRKSQKSGGSHFEMYKKEYPDFRAALYTAAIDTLPMWWELDRLFDFKGV
jgi:(p)ppGpp synthase/HD superfamily hydrolase